MQNATFIFSLVPPSCHFQVEICWKSGVVGREEQNKPYTASKIILMTTVNSFLGKIYPMGFACPTLGVLAAHHLTSKLRQLCTATDESVLTVQLICDTHKSNQCLLSQSTNAVSSRMKFNQKKVVVLLKWPVQISQTYFIWLYKSFYLSWPWPEIDFS